MEATSLMIGTVVSARYNCKLSKIGKTIFPQVYLEELMHPDQLDGELDLAPG